MSETAKALWSTGQIALSALIVVACAVIALASRRGAMVGPAETIARAAAPWRTALGAAFVAVGAFLVWRGDDPIGIRLDSYSDANVLVSGWEYARSGLWARYGAPQHQVTSASNPPDPFYYYTKYPAGSNLIHGALQIAGFESFLVHRLVPAVCSLLGACLWLGTWRRYVRAPVASLATITLLTSFGFLAYADSLHFHAYGFAAVAGAVYCFVRAVQAGEPRRIHWFVLCGAVLLAGSLFTWEYHLWFLVFVAGHTILFPPPVRRRWLVLLLVPFLLAAGLAMLQRRLAEPAIDASSEAKTRQSDSLLDVIYRRTIGFDTSLDTPPGLDLRGYPAYLAWRVFAFYGVPPIGLLAVLILLIILARAEASDDAMRSFPAAAAGAIVPGERAGTRLHLVLLIAGGAWWCIMMQHTSVHLHVMRHALPAYALAMALAWTHCARIMRQATCGWPGRIAAAVLALVLLCAHAEGTAWNVRMHLADELLDARGRNDVGAVLTRQLAEVRPHLPAGGVVLTNLYRLPVARASLRRPVYFAAAFKMPRNDPQRGRWLMELAFNHLRELYHDRLPPLYYLYHVVHPTLDEAFAKNHQFRALLLGMDRFAREDWTESQWARARAALEEMMANGRSDKSACPIVGHVDRLIVFDLRPQLEKLMRLFAPFGYPTREEFGPIP